MIVILTTSIGGRPDTMRLIQEVYTSWQAEVVFITSNFQGNKELMEGCKESGIPAFVRHFPASYPTLRTFTDMTRSDLGHSVGFLSSIDRIGRDRRWLLRNFHGIGVFSVWRLYYYFPSFLFEHVHNVDNKVYTS